MDTYGGWDLKDPSKSHHPLVAGRISMTAAHNVIHWGLALLTALGCIMTLQLSPAPAMALPCLLMWVAWGHSYNDGLDKESPFSFIPISLCFTFMGCWGWLLSHSGLNVTGWLYLAYTFLVILFQISYSGFKKEMLVKERSNILVRLGAKVEDGFFKPSRARIYGVTIKGLNWLIGLLLLLQNFNTIRLLWFLPTSALIFVFLIRLTKPREYIRDRELLDMSLEEVASIYLVIPILLDSLVSALLMVIGLCYFLIVNRILWEAPFPRV
jgi:4-hydroxybenzoate polyprenyltransferase